MLVYLLKIKEVRVDVMTYVETYDIAFTKDWWCLDELMLCLSVDRTRKVRS